MLNYKKREDLVNQKNYYKDIKGRINYIVECQTMDDDYESMNIWFNDYMEQFKQKGIEKELLIKDYKANLLSDNVIEIDFTIKSKKSSPELERVLAGIYDSKLSLIKCKWILKYEIINNNEKIYYKVIGERDPYIDFKSKEEINVQLEKKENIDEKNKTDGEYDKKYTEADEKSNKEYYKDFIDESMLSQKYETNTYRIQDDNCSFSCNNGKTWINVPISLEELCKICDGHSNYNKLQDGSYIISPERTIFTYGGIKEIPLSIIKSEDGGKTWKTVKVDNENRYMYCGRLKFISFVSDKVGYIFVTTERVVAQEAKAIFKTIDGGNSWKEIKSNTDINSHMLSQAIFLTENLGFMSMVCNEKPEIYRTEDGGKTWDIIEIPMTNYYIQPEIPYLEDGKLCMLLNEGELGLTHKKALYVSNDNGKNFKFEKEIEMIK